MLAYDFSVGEGINTESYLAMDTCSFSEYLLKEKIKICNGMHKIHFFKLKNATVINIISCSSTVIS